jgi:hypothetical protein
MLLTAQNNVLRDVAALRATMTDLGAIGMPSLYDADLWRNLPPWAALLQMTYQQPQMHAP